MSATPRSKRILGALRRRMLAFLSVKAVLGLALTLALATLAAVLADALLILPESLRAHAPWILAVLALVVIVLAVLAFRRLSEGAVARTLERTQSHLGTALTNAVQLAHTPLEPPTAEVLRLEAVEFGRAKARTAHTWPAARRGLLAVLAAALLAALLWTAGLLFFGDVFRAVFPRYLDPHGDHPPYSRLRIDVDPRDAEVLFGGQCEIRATAEGTPVEKLFLVARDAKGETSTVMFLRPDHSHSQTLINLREDTTFWVTDGRARSLRHTIHVRYTPAITFLEIKTTYPAYTGLQPRTVKLKESTLEVPKNSVLSFRAGSNRPLARGTLELTPVMGGEKKTVTMTPEPSDPQVVTGEFKVEDAAVFSVSLSDVDGLESQESRKGRVTILPDMRPRIFVLEPGRRAVATPDVSIPIVVRAEDDYAVDQVVWLRGLNRSIERPVRMKNVVPTAQGAVEARGEFNLRDLGVRPGDHVTYFFEARDNDPTGPNVTTSRFYTLDVISVEEYKDILQRLAAQRALFQQYSALNSSLRRTVERAETLRDRLRDMSKTQPTEAELAQMRKLAQELRKALGEYRKDVDRTLQAGNLFDIEKDFKDDLRAQADDLDNLQGRLDRMMEETGSNRPLDLAELEKIVDRMKDLAGQMDQNIGQPVQLITSVVRVLQLADEFTRLAARQKELAALARRFENQKGELSREAQMELQELAASQRQVRDGLQRFTELLPELLDKVPDDDEFAELKQTATDFLKRIADADIQTDLNTATEKFSLLDGPGAYTPAQDAAYKMIALLEKLDAEDLDGAGELALRFQPGVGDAMARTLAEVLAALRGGMGVGGGGFGLLGNDVGLYGPDMELAGEPLEGQGEPQGSSSAPSHDKSVAGPPDKDLPQPGPAAVRLERNARFPLRYRNLVGEYFRIIAESVR